MTKDELHKRAYDMVVRRLDKAQHEAASLRTRNAALVAMLGELDTEADRVGSVSIDKGKSTHQRIKALLRENTPTKGAADER